MTISLSSPNSSTASIQKNGGDVITFDANNNATFAGNVVTTGTVVSGSAMGMRNRIINGDMRIDQRNAGATTSTTNGYTLDRFYFYSDISGVATTVQQVSDAPTGFTNSLKVTASTGATAGTGKQSVIGQSIEGYNISDLAWGTASAKTITISFWVKSSLTGTFAGNLQNAAPNRDYVFTYAISAANTWEYKTITIVGDTSGTWGTSNGIGLVVYFNMGSNQSGFAGTANTWSSSIFRTVTGAVELLQTTGATWQITGVQLEIGTSATPFERRIYSTELTLCQRYYENSYDTGTAVGTNIGNDSQSRHTIAVVSNSKAWSIGTPYKVKKRTNPSVTLYNRAGTSGQWFWGTYGVNEASSSTIIAASCQNELQVIYTSSYPSGTNGGYGHFTADAEL
jgi:hypothetical protein